MQKIYAIVISACALLLSTLLSAQNLPHTLTNSEKNTLNDYILTSSNRTAANVFTTPPGSPVRCMAEWEELQGLLVTWTSFTGMLTEIVREAKQECRVYIVTGNTNSVINTLNAAGVDTTNITFLNNSFNSVWSRDYGPWSVYTNDVDSLLIIDWIYNRPRPADDVIPIYVANELNVPLYQTNTNPWDLVHTGGNFMTDGMGTGFSSKLILNENSSKSEAAIDNIMQQFMGIDNYIKMDNLPYDVIHHIDMHMKLLDEETILMGEYPAGIADGPQIEANLLYVLNNYMSPFGTPYKVIRMPMPPNIAGQYPNNGANYYTHVNSVIVNKTILVPIYNLSTDTTALRIYREAMPGYKIVGINSNQSISSLGAIHCINKEIGTNDPLLIIHNDLEDTYDDVNPYQVDAIVKHRSGISNATLMYATDTLLPYQSAVMTLTNVATDTWTAYIPAQTIGTSIYYYVEAMANSGKMQVRPLPAPAGYWHFDVLSLSAINNFNETKGLIWGRDVFPNPSNGISCLTTHSNKIAKATIQLTDIRGKLVVKIYDGDILPGENHYFIKTRLIEPGVYLIVLRTAEEHLIQKLIIQ